MSYIDVLPYIPPVDLMTFAENITSHILRFLNDPTTEHFDWLNNYIDEYLWGSSTDFSGPRLREMMHFQENVQFYRITLIRLHMLHLLHLRTTSCKIKATSSLIQSKCSVEEATFQESWYPWRNVISRRHNRSNIMMKESFVSAPK